MQEVHTWQSLGQTIFLIILAKISKICFCFDRYILGFFSGEEWIFLTPKYKVTITEKKKCVVLNSIIKKKKRSVKCNQTWCSYYFDYMILIYAKVNAIGAIKKHNDFNSSILNNQASNYNYSCKSLILLC